MMILVDDFSFEMLLKMANLHGKARLQQRLDDNPELFDGMTPKEADQLRHNIIYETAQRYVDAVANRCAAHIRAADYQRENPNHQKED